MAPQQLQCGVPANSGLFRALSEPEFAFRGQAPVMSALKPAHFDAQQQQEQEQFQQQPPEPQPQCVASPLSYQTRQVPQWPDSHDDEPERVHWTDWQEQKAVEAADAHRLASQASLFTSESQPGLGVESASVVGSRLFGSCHAPAGKLPECGVIKLRRGQRLLVEMDG